MNYQLSHPRDQLVAVMNRIYQNGMTTLSGGNLSIKDDDADIWITPAGVDKGSLSVDDIMRVRADGSVEGPHQPSSEYPFHRAIYEERPDLRAIIHAHPPALVSFSIARQIPETGIIPQANRVCGQIGYAAYAQPGSEALGENIARAFGEMNNIVILENHGLATGGSSLLTAFQRLETLDFCARTLIRAHGLGTVNVLAEEELDLFDRRRSEMPEMSPVSHPSRERELRKQIVDVVHRAYARYLMISTEGVVSARVDGNNFLITPTGKDRGNIALEDIVLVKDGRQEKGKRPSRSAHLHQSIYDHDPAVNCVIMAQCPNVMAYATTSTPFETRTIPESYILLREMQRIPFRLFYENPDQVAEHVSLSNPVSLVQNDCVLVAGKSVLDAFDRLEVAEYSARSLIDTGVIGAHVPIGEGAIQDLETRFSLS